MNFEEGGENSVLHGDAASEAFLSDVLGAKPLPGQRNMNVESMFEYGSRAGFWRLWRMFAARKIPLTVYGVADALARNPSCVAAMREAEWEIASHGLKWIDYKDFSYADEHAHMREAIRVHTEATGERPLGWYTGRTSPHTLKLVLDDGGFLYSSDSYADDLPYWVNGPKGPHLIIPYTLDANDMRFINPQGFPEGEAFYTYLRGAFDEIPSLRMIQLSQKEIANRAQDFCEKLRRALSADVSLEVHPGFSVIGGGSTPDQQLPTTLIAISTPRHSAAQLEELLRNPRAGNPEAGTLSIATPVIARIEENHLILDLRTVDPSEETEVASALTAALA